MQYAINIADMAKLPAVVIAFLIEPVCPGRQVVDAEPRRIDGTAVLLECSADHAEIIVRALRQRWPRNLMRCYQSQTGESWKRM